MSALLIGCAKSPSAMQGFKYHENAKRKPVVAMLPVISRVTNYLPWDLSEEFTSEIARRIMDRSNIYINSGSFPMGLRKKLEQNDTVILKKEDFAELKSQNDFVVLLELIEHDEAPYQSMMADNVLGNEEIDRTLSMKMRVKVIDIRNEEPKLVLHEMIEVNHLIPRTYASVNYEKVVWGSDAYPATAYGRAHAKLESDLSRQIENYVKIAH